MTRTHEIKLDGYGAHTTLAEDRPVMLLGTAESYGIEMLHIVPGKDWAELTITATFNAADGTSTDMLMNTEGNIAVPTEATAKSGSGRIVFTGVSDGIQRISCDLDYFVVAHSGINGTQSGGVAPSWFEQAANRFMPLGGTTGQVLTKKSDADFEAEWQDSKGGAGLEPLVGTNKTLTPTQVKEAFLKGQPIVFSFIDVLGEVAAIFQSFEIYDDIIVASTILPPLIGSQDMGVVLVTGYLSSNVWDLSETLITNPDDIQAAINTALAAAKASGEFDGADGITPTIGDNGNWYLGSTDTGKPSRGDNGKSAYSYAQDGGYTGTEAEFAAKLAAEKLPNPYPLTFTGAVSETYDGSSAKTIEIPSGGAHSDWNQNDSTAADYIKNRPFYTGDPVETVLVEESTVSFAELGNGLYMTEFESTFVPTVGEVYKVSWDGTVYECTCVEFSGGTVIGNLSIAGAGSDTGEPFIMTIFSGETIMIGTLDTSASHTFSISGRQAPIVKIPAKYIDKDTSGYIVIHHNSIMTEEEARKYARDLNANEVRFIIWGNIYIIKLSFIGSARTLRLINLNGEEYSITKNDEGLYDYNDIKLSGSRFPYGFGSLTNPANINSDGTKIQISPKSFFEGMGTTDTLFYVEPNGTKAKPFEVLGNGMAVTPALILYSSTAGSTKKFKITVDDSGTIAATEVV